MRRLLTHAPLAVTDARWSEPRTKANALLQAHFSRQALSGDLAADQRTVVLQATRLLQVPPWLELPPHCRVHCPVAGVAPQSKASRALDLHRY